MKTKTQRLFPSDKFMCVFSGSRQVNALRDVCGGDGVKRVVCRYRWECFECLIEEGAFWGLLNFYLLTFFCIVYAMYDKRKMFGN